MATWRFEIALLVLKNILLASPLTCEIFFNTQREISYLNATLYYPLLPSPSTFPFHLFPSFLAPYPLLRTFSPPSCFLIYLSCPLYVHPLFTSFPLQLFLSIFFPLFLLLISSSSYLSTLLVFSPLPFLPPICSPSPLLLYPWTSPFHLFPSFLAPYPLRPSSPHSLCSLLYLSCPHYLHPLFTSFPLQLLLSIFFPLFLLLILFVLPLHTPCVLSSTFPAPITSTLSLLPSPFNFSFPSFSLFFPPSLSSPLLPSPFPPFPFNFSFLIFFLFFLPPDPFLPTPLHPSCSLLYLSCPLYLHASFNYFPLQLFLSIFSPFFLPPCPHLPTS